MKGISALAIKNLVRNKGALFLSSVGIIFGIASFVFFVSLGNGIKSVVFGKILAQLPVNIIEVTPKSSTIGIFSFGGISASHIEDSTVDTISSIKGVKAVYKEVVLDIPIQAKGEFYSRRIVTDLAATGIDPEIVRDDIKKGYSFEYQEDGPIPVIVSKHLLELYNSNIAQAMKLPRLTQDAIIGFKFKLIVGRSFLSGVKDSSKIREYECQLVGFSDKAILLGITIPIEYVRRFKNDIEGIDEIKRYKKVYVIAENSQIVPKITAEISSMGLEIDKTRKTIGGVISIATLILGMLSILIVALSAINISNTFALLVFERRREIGVLRALGGTKGDIRYMIFLEASIAGIINGLIGILLGFLFIKLTDFFARNNIPDFPYKPDTFFEPNILIFLVAITFSVFFCTLGALLPSIKASKIDPARALTM
ncbi:MAG: ABC transporter permease [Deltaproteobacteria bacterium]|nr:ABC transporter permease [Deltaproteobacteria bacterium]